MLIRPYDMAFPSDGHHSLVTIKKRREHPTGELREVRQIERGNEVVNEYPWDKLELGDFFLAPIGLRSKQAMRVGFARAAARHDFEIMVVEAEHNNQKCFRVTLTVINLRQWKKKAQQHHDADNIRFHDVKHAKRKRTKKFRHEFGGGPAPKKRRKHIPVDHHPLDQTSPLTDQPLVDEQPMSIEEMRQFALRDDNA